MVEPGPRFAASMTVALVCGMIGCGMETTPVGDRVDVTARLPSEVAGWRAADDGEVYDAESIFSYIDGHAEVYLAYGMTRCLARRYAGPEGEPDIVLDLYELASPADAFGVFTHDRDGDDVDVGQGGLFRHGWLSFWKGRWFGSVYAEGESQASAEAVLAIGRAAADAIAEVGELPLLVADLPAAGLDHRSVRFLHTQEILNGVVYLGYDNPLLFGPDVDAVVGRYELPEGRGWLLLADYPDEAMAGRAERGATEAGLAVRRRGSRLAAVLAPEPATVADTLLVVGIGDQP
jgi:hypothetical protein